MKELDWEYIDALMPRRAAESSKNDYGRILCVCGSAGYTGAAFFAAQGAVRMGSGVVTLAVPERAWPVLAVKLSEPVVRPLPCTEDGLFSIRALPRLLELAEHADALLIGCGLGRSDEVTEVVCTLLCEAACPIVLDADGIFALAQHKDILHRTAKPLVMTPHAGEFARLSGKKQMQPEELRAFAQENRCTVLYKAHRTLIAAPDGRLLSQYLGQSRHGEGRQRRYARRHAGLAHRAGTRAGGRGLCRGMAARRGRRQRREPVRRVRHDADRPARVPARSHAPI